MSFLFKLIKKAAIGTAVLASTSAYPFSLTSPGEKAGIPTFIDKPFCY